MKTLKAVIVEDDPYFAKMFVTMLKKSNRIEKVKIFRSGEQFIQGLTSALDFAVVFLDIQLPGIAGSELGKKLKETRPEIQVVFVTGETAFGAEAFDIEAVDYLIKPFDSDRLNRCLTRVFKRLDLTVKKYTISNKLGTFRININNIVFIEKVQKTPFFIQ